MSDDLNNKIKHLASLLGQDNLPDDMVNMISNFASTMQQSEKSQKNESDNSTDDNSEKNNNVSEAREEVTELPAKIEKKGGNKELEENLEMLRKVKKIMDKMNKQNDPRVTLLSAMSPFLNDKRQKKVANCIKILNMSSLTSLFEEKDLF